MTFPSKNFLKGLNQGEFYPDQSVEIDNISLYKSEEQEAILKITAKSASIAVVSFMGVSLLVSPASAYALIKITQMLGFLLLINIEHPRNLKNFIESLSQSIFDNV